MNDAYDGARTLEISGDLTETVKSYLTVDTTDEVLDLEIYENHLGDRCVAAAIQTESRRPSHRRGRDRRRQAET